MDKSIQDLLNGGGSNYILPFLWMRGESDDIIRKEIEKINDCGIKAICLEARPHPDFAGEGWWHDVDTVLDEAKKRDMKIWILDDAHFPTGLANGLLAKKYPERAKQYVMTKCYDVTGPLPFACLDINEVMKKEFSWMDLGKDIVKPLIDENKLLSVTAMKLIDGDIVSENSLDLTGFVSDGLLQYSFPEGIWRVCVNFTTYDGGGNREYINVIDKDSVNVLIEAVYEPHYKRYKNEFGKTFMGFFSDEPGFGNQAGFSMDESIGRKMMPLPWNKEAAEMLKDRLGHDWNLYLPYLWYPSEDKITSANVRFVYMDVITRLYEKNFSCQLGKWCEQHGVEYIGHVIEDNNQHSKLGCGAGHYFRAMSGQHMAGIDNIGGQIIFGNSISIRHGVSDMDGKFFHYALSKMGASEAQFDPKKKGRLLCETFGAYGWGLGVKNMKWITDHLISRGVNYLVPHAFSMAEYPDKDCPPHFHARGNNHQFPYFTELMKYANRLCHIFNDGKAVPEVGILYHGEMEWTNDCMFIQEPAKVLFENQIDFLIVPIDALEEKEKYQTSIQNGFLSINNITLKYLIVAETEFVDQRLVSFLKSNPEIKLLFINKKPKAVIDSKTELDNYLNIYPTATLETLVEQLKSENIVGLETSEYFPEIVYYHYKKSQSIYFLFNESACRTFDGTVKLPENGCVIRYNALKNKIEPIEQKREDGGILCSICLEPYESIILTTVDSWSELYLEKNEKIVKYISDEWKVSLANAKEYPKFSKAVKYSKLEPISLKYPLFSGIMKYEKNVWIDNADLNIFLEIESVYEVAKIWINGVYAGISLSPPYRFDLTGYVINGENLIEIEVANTLARDVLKYDMSPFGPERSILEPSGMFGEIRIIQLN